MDIPQIYVTQKHFKIITAEAKLIIPKTEASSAIIEMMKPALENTKNHHNQLHLQLLPQFRNILELIELFKDKQGQFPEGEFREIMLRLEETYYFIYDQLKLMEIEIPANLFIENK